MINDQPRIYYRMASAIDYNILTAAHLEIKILIANYYFNSASLDEHMHILELHRVKLTKTGMKNYNPMFASTVNTD